MIAAEITLEGRSIFQYRKLMLARDNLKRRGRPATDSKPILVRIAPTDLELLDAFRGLEADDPTRPEAIRRLIHRGLGTLKTRKVRR